MLTVGVDLRVLGTGRTSGIEEYTERLLEHMLPLEHGISWKLFTAGRRPLVRRPWMELPRVSVFDTGRSNRILQLRMRLAGRPYLDRLIGGASVFFFPHFLWGTLSPACRRVMTWHDVSYERMPELFSLWHRFWHQYQMRPRMQAQLADRIVAVSASTRDDLVRWYGIPTDRIDIIHSGVDPALRRPATGEIESFRVRHGLPQRFIFSFGTMEPRKNVDGLVTAFERFAGQRRFLDVHLVIAGPEGWLMRPTLARIAASPWRTRIRLIGPVPFDQRSLWLSAATIVAYPSLLEGFGFPPLEAMTCGTPVVAGANSSMMETVGDAGLLVDPYSADRIARSLTALLDDERLRSLLVQRGVRRMAAFSWPTAAERTLKAIVSVL
jgi:glycosyltransferase involved in cell wall biosynthesis